MNTFFDIAIHNLVLAPTMVAFIIATIFLFVGPAGLLGLLMFITFESIMTRDVEVITKHIANTVSTIAILVAIDRMCDAYAVPELLWWLTIMFCTLCLACFNLSFLFAVDVRHEGGGIWFNEE